MIVLSAACIASLKQLWFVIINLVVLLLSLNFNLVNNKELEAFFLLALLAFLWRFFVDVSG